MTLCGCRITDVILRHCGGEKRGEEKRGEEKRRSKKRGLTITDATACVGGNTISFSKQFANVNAVELDRDRCKK